MEAIRYQSPFGWCMQLPAGWRVLTEVAGTVVFVHNENEELTFSWTCTPPVDDQVAIQFKALTTSPGAVSVDEAQVIVQRIFPILGKFIRCDVEELGDGARCLRTEDSFMHEVSKQIWRGTQLITLIAGNPFGKARFQRLAFFAEGKQFDVHAKRVNTAMNTFSYERTC